MEKRPDRLDGLDPSEKAACLVAERVLGVVAEAWDVDKRQGAFDALLHYPDGRRAAFEVSKLAADGKLQLDSLLGRDDFSWPLPGRWSWSLMVDDVQDLPRLRQVYGRIILLCEAAGVARPEHLWSDQEHDDADLSWLVEESTSVLVGNPDLPRFGGPKGERGLRVVPSGRGGGIDYSLAGLRAALKQALASPHLQRRVRKLQNPEARRADERHLFIPVHRSALPFPVAVGLVDGHLLPPDPAPLPDGLTHLWLAPGPRRVLLYGRDGWQQAQPYDR